MRGGHSWKVQSLGLHLGLWVVLALWSYQSAGPFALASCWPIAMIYPPYALLWTATGLISLAVVVVSLGRPQMRSGIWFLAACHGLMLLSGMLAARLAAHVSAGEVSCL